MEQEVAEYGGGAVIPETSGLCRSCGKPLDIPHYDGGAALPEHLPPNADT
jgi:hypothetical protein